MICVLNHRFFLLKWEVWLYNSNLIILTRFFAVYMSFYLTRNRQCFCLFKHSLYLEGSSCHHKNVYHIWKVGWQVRMSTLRLYHWLTLIFSFQRPRLVQLCQSQVIALDVHFTSKVWDLFLKILLLWALVFLYLFITHSLYDFFI